MLILIACTAFLFRIVPGGYVPQQDKNYLIGIAQLPDAASLERTEAVIRRMSAIALEHPGCRDSVRLPGPVHQRLLQRAQRGDRVLRAEGLRRAQRRRAVRQRDRRRAEPEARLHPGRLHRSCFRRHRSSAWGRSGGFKLMIEDRGDRGLESALRRHAGAYEQGTADRVSSTRTRRSPASRSTCRSCMRTSIASRPSARGGDHRRVRDHADLPGVALRQRLQPLRAHLPGDRAGGRTRFVRSRRTSLSSRRATAVARWSRSAR